jgi:hypothetical protein
VDPKQRPSIEQVLAHPLLPQEQPALLEWQLKLRSICDDFIERANVHQFSGQQAFTEHLE